MDAKDEPQPPLPRPMHSCPPSGRA